MRGCLRHGGNLFLIGQRAQRQRGGGSGIAGEGDPSQAVEHLPTNARVRVAAGDGGERLHVVDAGRRGAPDPRVVIFPRKGHEHRGVFVTRAELLHRGGTNFRIWRFVLGLDFEAIEERHEAPYSFGDLGIVDFVILLSMKPITTSPNHEITKCNVSY